LSTPSALPDTQARVASRVDWPADVQHTVGRADDDRLAQSLVVPAQLRVVVIGQPQPRAVQTLGRLSRRWEYARISWASWSSMRRPPTEVGAARDTCARPRFR
jgi:hypothetical protein